MTTDKIEPALTAEEWAKGIPGVFGWDDGSVFIDWRDPEPGDEPNLDRPHAIIAAINATLPDSDPRKITPEKIALMRYALGLAVGNMGDDEAPDAISAAAFLDALSSYLPPERT